MLLAAYRLAFHFHRPPSELCMTMREFHTCLAYMHIEPPAEADNRRTASLMAQIANMAGRSLPDKKMVSADDYLGKAAPQQTAAEQKEFMLGLKGK